MTRILLICFFCAISLAQVSDKMPDKPRPAKKVDPDNIHEKMKKKYPNSFQLSTAKKSPDSSRVITKNVHKKLDKFKKISAFQQKAKTRILIAKQRLEELKLTGKISESEFKKKEQKILLAEEKIRELQILTELKAKKNSKKH